MGSITFGKDPFAAGASRWSFKGSVSKGSFCGFSTGTDIVVKAIKSEEYNQGVRMTEDDIEAQKVTANYAKTFNQQISPTKPVYVRIGALFKSEKNQYNSRGTRLINKGETLLVEGFIHGHYQKFNSNSGWTSGEYQLPDAFSHWSWVHSGGEHLICDLQGYRGAGSGPKYGGETDYYLFTDPVVMTNGRGGRFGCTDLGQEGIKSWFNEHVCTDFCRSIGVAGKKPGRARYCRPVRRCTTYAT